MDEEPFDRGAAVAQLIDLVRASLRRSEHASYAGDNLFLDTEPVRRLSRELKSRTSRESEIGGPDEADRWIVTDLDVLGRSSSSCVLRDFKSWPQGEWAHVCKESPVRRCSPHATRSREALAGFQRAADEDWHPSSARSCSDAR